MNFGWTPTIHGLKEHGAFKGMQKDLQKLWEMQQRFGVSVDANTQGILDKASADGLIGPEFMDPVVSELVGIGETLKVIARQGGASDSDLVGTPRNQAAAAGGVGMPALFPQPLIPQLGGDGAFARAAADVMASGGAVASDAIVSAINGLSKDLNGLSKDLAASLASQPIDLNLPVSLDGNAIAGGLQARIERGTATGLVTALHRKIKDRD